MNLFANTRIQRNTAFVVLMVWLFALASSVANACILETDEPHSEAAKASAPPTSHAPAEVHAQLGSRAGHQEDLDGGKESCLKVCDDGTHTLPKAYAGVDHNDPGPAPLITTLWAGSPHVVPAPRHVDAWAVPIVGPPFRLRYARLAL